MKRNIIFVVSLSFLFTGVSDAYEVKLKDLDKITKEKKAIILDKKELSKYLMLKQKPLNKKEFLKQTQKPEVTDFNDLIAKETIVGSLKVLQKHFSEKKIIIPLILKKAKNNTQIDYSFFKNDLLKASKKELSKIIKALS